MYDYTVNIEVQAPDGSTYSDNDAERLAQLGGAASVNIPRDRIGATITSRASDIVAAMQWISDRVLALLGGGEIVALDACTVDEHDRRLSDPAFPELVGISEIAEILEVTRQRASTLQTRHDFPAPVATLRSGPVWRRADLETFATTWERKPGRPSRSAASGVRGITSDLAKLRP